MHALTITLTTPAALYCSSQTCLQYRRSVTDPAS